MTAAGSIDDWDVVVQGDGPGLLLVHGAGGGVQANFGSVLAELARDHRVVAPHYPGAGATPARPRLDLDELADALAEVAHTAGVTTAVVVGESMGCAIAVRAARRHPDLVTGLVLTVGFAVADPVLGVAAEVVAALDGPDPDTRETRARFLTLSCLTDRDIATTEKATLDAWVAATAASAPPGTASHFELAARLDVRDDLAHIAVPTLVFAADGDRLVQPASHRHLAETIPDAHLVELTHAAHVLDAENRRYWLHTVRDFLRRHRDDRHPVEPATRAAGEQDGSTGTVEVNGTRTWFAEHGRGAPLVYLHGGFSDSGELDPVLPRYTEHFHVVTPDRRGHGRTPDVDGPVDYRILADDTIAFLETVVSAPADLVGYSDGATTALHVALARPDLVDRLVLISGQFHHDGLLDDMFGDDPAAAAHALTHSPLARRHAEISPDGPEHFLVTATKVIEMAGAHPTLDHADLATITARTLVIAADDDAVTAEHTLDLFRHLPDAELAVVPGTSHVLIAEKPGHVATLALAFLLTGPAPPTITPIRRARREP